MTPAQLQSLFQPFNRLGRDGSGIQGVGIGLVVTRQLTEAMGGSLVAASVPEAGSTFSVRLPAFEAA
jgi:signal transduction histidine kinase